MQIVLVGYMGSGKSTIGKQLSKLLKISFLDLDDYMEQKLGMSVPDIFSEKGEIFFRKFETECLLEVFAKKKNFVIATGGGTPCYGSNLELMQENTNKVIYLKASIGELVNRLQVEKEHRPLIKNIEDEELPEFIGKHLFERSYFYNKSDIIVSTDNKTPLDIAKEITDLI